MKSFTIKVMKEEIMEVVKGEGYSFTEEQIQECLEKLEDTMLEFIGNEIREILWNVNNNQ